MSKSSLFVFVNTGINSTVSNRFHLQNPRTPYMSIVDAQGTLLVFWTKREYFNYLDTRDLELFRY